MITLDGRAVRRGTAPSRDEAADAVDEALEELPNRVPDRWVMRHLSAVPGVLTPPGTSPSTGPLGDAHGQPSRAVPVGVGPSREQTVSIPSQREPQQGSTTKHLTAPSAPPRQCRLWPPLP
jgi:hypothetical protein